MDILPSGTVSDPASQQLAVFRRAAALLSSSLDLEQTLANTISAFLPALGDFGFFDAMMDDEVRRTARAHDDPHTEAIIVPTRWARREHAELNLCALSTGQPALHTGIDDAWYRRIATSDDHLAVLRTLAFRSMLTVPVWCGDELIGALTLFMGRSGRQHTQADLDFASDLAALASPVVVNARLLEKQHKSEAALRAGEERLRLATDAGRIGIWDWDIVGDAVTWSDRLYDMHGIAPGSFGGKLDDFLALVHPRDRTALHARVAAAIHNQQTFAAEFRILLPDGRERWLSTWAHLYRDGGGTATRMVGATLNVTEQKHAQRRLQDVNAILEERIASSTSERDRIWRMSQDILAIASVKGYFVSVNPAFQTILGWTSDEALTIPFLSLVHPDQHAEAVDKIGLLAQGMAVERFEIQVRHKSGGYRWLSLTITPEKDLLYGVARDVTELRKQGELLLQASETRLQLALEVGGMGAWQWDIRSDTSTWWPGMERLHGLASGAPVYSLQNYERLVHPDDRAHLAQVVGDALREKRSHRVEYRVIWPDGSVRWLEGRSELKLDEHGEPLEMAGICVDITQRKRTEQDLRFVAEVSAALSSLVDHEQTLDKVARLAVPFFADWCAVDLLDDQGGLKRVAVAHVDPEKVALGYELYRRYPPDPRLQNGTWKVIRTGQVAYMPEITDAMLAETIRDPEYLAILRALGLRSYIGVPLAVRGKTLGVITFISSENRRIYSTDDVLLAEDIGRRAAIAIENARLYRSLQDADRRKDEFLAMLAHELRNPLAPIRAAADLLKLPIGEARIKKTSDVISRQVDHMTGLVDDLLDVSRVTRGLVVLDRQPVDLKTVTAAAIEQVRPLIEARGHRMALIVSPESLIVEGDEKRLVQVLANLVNNAAKYTPEHGKIDVHIDAEESAWSGSEGAQHGSVVLTVRDNGIGMSPELVECAFELFAQAERTSDRAQGGLGLGLALVKSLVELHGGTVRAHSAGPHRGSEFSVRLPRLRNAPRRNADAQPPLPSTAATPLRILLVDDNADAADTLGTYLQAAGHQVHVEHEPHAALALSRREVFDACLLDIGLPGIDGNELARRIRQLWPLRPPVLIAVTGYGQEHDRDAALAGAFDHYLVKPVSARRLSQLLDGIIPNHTG